MAVPSEVENDCQQPAPDDPSTMCGAAAAVGQRCLAHLSPDARTEWLAAMAPGSDINVRGVTFSDDLLAEFLNALRGVMNNPEIGAADFSEATFSGTPNFSKVAFSGEVKFIGASFSGDAKFNGVTFAKDAWFPVATFIGSADFNGVSFAGKAWFDGATIGAARFHDVVFSGDASFSGATLGNGRSLGGDASFEGATFTRHASFPDATFSTRAFFSHTTFAEEAWFEEATFSGDAWFGGATFGTAKFDGATFSGDAVFDGATFEGGPFRREVSFDGAPSEAVISRGASYDRATFSGEASFVFVTFMGAVSFNGTVVHRGLEIVAAAKQVSARTLRGEGRVSLALRAAEVDLSGVVLAGPVRVHGLEFPIEGTDETMFRAGTGEVSPVRVVSLRDLDASPVTLTDVDLSECRLVGLYRADQIVLDGQCVFADGPGGRRRVLAEEHHWRATRATAAGGRSRRTGGWHRLPDHDRDQLGVVGPERLEVLYRQLRKALEDAKNEPGAADFYYGEMEMRRAATTTRRAERWLLGLYWAVSGYGLRARRVLAWLALVIVLSVGGLAWFGFPQTATNQKAGGTVATPSGRQPITLTIRESEPVKPLSDRIENATEVTLNAVIFRNPDADLTTPGRYLDIATRILGPILLGLSILAIRNQVKR